MSLVRESKFRHIYGKEWRKERTFENLRSEDPYREANPLASNKTFWATPWQTGGGGSIAVWPKNNICKLPDTIPLITGHSGTVMSFDFNPFDDYMLATGCEDAHVRVFRIPSEEGLTEDISEPEIDLIGHNSKVLTTDFHPTAKNILTTSGGDTWIKFWDIDAEKEAFTFDQHTDLIYNIAWNHSGDLFATSSRDKKIRIGDPRSNTVTQCGEAHSGTRGGRVLWKGNEDKLISVGFSKLSERQLGLWDARDLSRPIKITNIDQANGYLMPFYDEANDVLFVGGKGDSNVRFYEINDIDPFIHFLNDWRGSAVQRALAPEHRTDYDVNTCEIMRLLKLTIDNTVQTIEFHVPRRSQYFQDDLYPETRAYGVPAVEGGDWLRGENGTVPTVSLQPDGVMKQSDAPKEEKSGPKYNAAEEIKKAEKKPSAQEQVFNMWSEHIFAAAESDEDDGGNKNDEDSDDSLEWEL
eukprot:gb/GECH01014510.1/.p1 GENE.gb/GECH01014510.1/~~gb/GECH01014510.1/.p1  ORF type:complete len:467 (+),score=121.28 gb/GECH01014510.1/:1-1401(+)